MRLRHGRVEQPKGFLARPLDLRKVHRKSLTGEELIERAYRLWFCAGVEAQYGRLICTVNSSIRTGRELLPKDFVHTAVML